MLLPLLRDRWGVHRGEDGQVQFAESAALTPEDLAAVQQQVRTRLLRWFARPGPLDPADAGEAQDGELERRRGFSLDASLRIGRAERAGLERPPRHRARPPFTLNGSEQVGDDQLI